MPLGVRWQYADLAVADHPELVFRQDRPDSGPTAFSGQVDQAGIARLAANFWELPRRRLVILGGAGAGKTSLALLLVNAVLEDLAKELRTGQGGRQLPRPVPVMLTLADWDPAAGPDRDPAAGPARDPAAGLYNWLTRRLNETYPTMDGFGPGTTRELIMRRMVLPVLDGLDELLPAARVEVLAALDKAEGPVIMTCRTGEYAAAVADPAGRVLTGAAVIELLPPQAADTEVYLRLRLPHRGRPGWPELFATLRQRPEHPLAQALTIPVNIWLLRSTYVDDSRDPRELLDNQIFATADAVTRHLLDGLLPAVFPAPEDLRRRDRGRAVQSQDEWLADATRWLSFLARQVQRSGSPRHGLVAPQPGPMAFLELAHRAGILRQVGALYQFRHVILTDYFAPPTPAQIIARHLAGAPRDGSWSVAAALAVAGELLADQLRVLGPDHPHSLRTRAWLATLRGQADGSAAAIADLREILADQLRLIGPDHPDTLATRQALDWWQGARAAADPPEPGAG